MMTPVGRTIRMGLLITLAVTPPALGLAGGLAGVGGALAAAGGLALAAAFFTVSKVVLTAVARRWPEALLGAALATYVLKIAVLGVLLVSIRDMRGAGLTCFAWSVMAGVVVWIVAELWVATHTRVPFYDPVAFEARRRERRDRASR